MPWQSTKIAGNFRLSSKCEMNQANDWRVGLNAFKDREMFRIDMRHILGYTPEFWDFAYGLTDLAEVVIEAAFHRCDRARCAISMANHVWKMAIPVRLLSLHLENAADGSWDSLRILN